MSVKKQGPSQPWQCILVCWGKKYSNTDINVLWKNIVLHDKSCVGCVLLTDRYRDGVAQTIKQKLIPAFFLQKKMLGPGCHAKLCMFEKGILQPLIPAIYVDLDAAVFGPLGSLVSRIKHNKGLMIIQSSRGLSIGALRRFIYRINGGRKFARANSSVVVFYPENWYPIASSFRDKVDSGAPLEGEYLITDDRYIAWFAQLQLQAVPKSHVVKFGSEFVLPTGWLSKLKGRLPWVRRRRGALVAVTLPGGDFKLSKLALLNDGDITYDYRGRPLFWDEKVMGVCQQKIKAYAQT